jgi:hypothetical protein
MSHVRLMWRWLASVAMMLAVLVGDGLHELSHSRGLAADAPAASGQLEVHSGHCPHHPHSPTQHDHGCLLCQHGLNLHALNSPACNLRAALPKPALFVCKRPEIAGDVLVSGALGARAPPLMSV